MANQRIYLVGTPDNKVRLIKASVRQQAVSYVANNMLTVRVASQDDLVKALTEGVEIEQYRQPEQQELIEDSESPAN
jgi:hypothetical protein